MKNNTRIFSTPPVSVFIGLLMHEMKVSIFFISFFCSLGFSSGNLQAKWENPLPTGVTLRKAVFAENKFFVVGDGGTLLVSIDGSQWATHLLPEGIDGFNDIIRANNLFAIIGNNGVILTSSDGNTWTKQNSGTINNLLSITFGNGMFVAVGNNSTVISSTDGFHWSNQDLGTGISDLLWSIAFGNNVFVAVGDNGVVFFSHDGSHWEIPFPAPYMILNNIVFGNNLFATVAANAIFTSTDGEQWIKQATDSALRNVNYVNDSFMITCGESTILASSNGLNWTTRTSSPKANIISIAYGNNVTLAVGSAGALYTTEDGSNWTNQTTYPIKFNLAAICFGNNRFVAYGHHIDSIITSENGSGWEIHKENAVGREDNKIEKMCYGNGLFVAAGHNSQYAGLIATSTDGLTWKRYAGTIQYGLHSVRYFKKKFFSVGDYGAIINSNDGSEWQAVDSIPTTQALGGIGFGNNTIIAVGVGGTILTSTDGKTWTKRNSGTTEDICGIDYGHELFVAAGVKGGILTSPDGITWTKRVSGMEEEKMSASAYSDWKTYANIAIGEGMFALVYFDGTFLSSTDGINWVKNKVPSEGSFVDIAYGNGKFVAVGDYGFIASLSFSSMPIKEKIEKNQPQNPIEFDISLKENLIFMNGASGNIHGPISMTLFSINGKKIHSSMPIARGGRIVFPVSATASGKYVAAVKGLKRTIATRPVVLTR
jgi:photosystem II stability/assembly factor-like uncharacterized protein